MNMPLAPDYYGNQPFPFRNLHLHDIDDKHCILGNSCKLQVTIAQMRTGLEPSGATDLHAFEPVSETGNQLSISDGDNRFLVIGQVLTPIELDGISKQNAVAFFERRAASRCLR